MVHPRLALKVVTIGLAIATSGCTKQLNSNTLDMQASYKGLLVKQTLYNLGQAEDDEHYFFPSQALIGTGTATTTNTITPTVSVPLPASTISNAVAVGAATTVTNTSQTAWGNATLGVSFADAWQYAWAMTPRTDPDELRRLRALYLYAVGKSSCPGEKRTDETSAKACLLDQYVMQGGKLSVNQAFTQRPGCVLCGQAANQSQLTVNDNLKFGFVRTSWQQGYKYCCRYGLTEFYIPEVDGEEQLANFLLFLLEAMSTATFIPYIPPTVKGAAPPTIQGMPPKIQFQQPNLFSLPL